jgi:DNA-binding NarL/FixJ family response regulator
MKSTERIRVCIIEDQSIVRAGVRMLLETQPDMEVVGEAGNREQAFSVVTQKLPNVLLFDIQLKDGSTLDFIGDLLAVHKARSIILTAASSEEDIHRAIQAGVTGLVFKHENPQVLLRAIRSVHSGEAWLSRSLMTAALSRFCENRWTKADPEELKIGTLTARERHIIALAATGLNRRGIAEKLFLSEGTVRNHLTSILRKLEVSNQIGLVLYAQHHGLDTLSDVPKVEHMAAHAS